MSKGLYLSPGNRRMNIPTFSLPAEETCPNATEHCKQYCYAKKAEKIWKGPRESRKRNYERSQKDYFVGDMFMLLRKKESEYIRVHESGDMYEQEYLDKWTKIMRAFPEKKFLIFSQMYRLDWSRLPDNAVLYWTVWDDSKDVPEEGLRAYVIDDGTGKVNPKNTKRLQKAHLCTKGKGSDLKCDDCMYCYNGTGDVKFKIH